jgi:hypothetical protein
MHLQRGKKGSRGKIERCSAKEKGLTEEGRKGYFYSDVST